MRTLPFMFVVIIGIGTVLAYKSHEELPIPHAPHSQIQYSIEQLLFAQHGPNVKCKRICAPAGFEDQIETDLPVVTCAGNTNPELSCARQGKQCGQNHRDGCAEFCRDQCCRCCSI